MISRARRWELPRRATRAIAGATRAENVRPLTLSAFRAFSAGAISAAPADCRPYVRPPSLTQER